VHTRECECVRARASVMTVNAATPTPYAMPNST
jgi:hypothetical protein